MEDKRVSDLTLKVLIEHYSKWGDTTEIEQSTTDALLELKQLRAELAAAKKTIEARDNECRDEHYTALCECQEELAKVTASNEARKRTLDGHSYCGMHGLYRGDAEVDPCPSCELARLRLEPKPKCYCCKKVIEYGFCDDCMTSADDLTDAGIKDLETEISRLRQERDDLRERGEALAEALQAARECHFCEEDKMCPEWHDMADTALDRWRNAKPTEGPG